MIVFPKDNKSYMEKHFDELFPILEYPNIKRNYTGFEWLKFKENNPSMRPDVYIENTNIVIEFQGEQHFYTNILVNGENYDKAIERDELKYKLLTEHGFTVIYFVDTKYYSQIPEKVPEKFEPGGYIGGTTIMTSWDELVNLVNEKLKETENNA